MVLLDPRYNELRRNVENYNRAHGADNTGWCSECQLHRADATGLCPICQEAP